MSASTDAFPMQPHVIVVGAGAAGLATALTAADGGLRVLLVEKTDRVGGMLHIANGEMSGAGTRRQFEHGISDDPDAHLAEVERLAHGENDHALTALTVRHQGETIDWLAECGFDFDQDCPGLVHGHEVYSVPRTYWGRDGGQSVLRVLHDQLAPHLESGRVRLLLNSELLDLCRADDEEYAAHPTPVCGVTIRSSEVIEHIGADAVVLATGGYDAAPQLRNEFLPAGCEDVLVGCLGHATGDGLRIARSNGAAVTSRGFFLPIMGLIPDPARPGWAIDYRVAFAELAAGNRRPHEIWVNAAGERFVAEDTLSPELRERALLQQPEVTMHIIFDAAALREAPRPLLRTGGGAWDAAACVEACESASWVTRGETIRDLGWQLGLDADSVERLEGEIAEYNAAVTAGGPDRFGREVLPAPIGRESFYAVTSRAASILSRDGLSVDTELTVLDETGTKLPGLFAVGEIIGNNTFAGDNYVGGMSVTPAITLGRLLGARLTASASQSGTVNGSTKGAVNKGAME